MGIQTEDQTGGHGSCRRSNGWAGQLQKVKCTLGRVIDYFENRPNNTQRKTVSLHRQGMRNA